MKPSIPRHHQRIREEVGEDWMQSLKPELEPDVQKTLGEGWKESAKKYMDKLEEEEKETELVKQSAIEENNEKKKMCLQRWRLKWKREDKKRE